MADTLENESAEALLSMKDGGRSTFTLPSPTRRGHPARIRKRNRLIFNDDEDTSFGYSRSPRKNPRVTKQPTVPAPAPVTAPLPSPITVPSYPIPHPPVKQAVQTINVRLRNMLKLPKAHKWVCYEWFYSNLDQPLFLGDNEFFACLRESFPQLKTRRLRRVEWCRIRKLMGKPRRCSPAFLMEERDSLHGRRQKIRQLQQRQAVNISSFGDLPKDIPLSLVIGTKVTARLRKPQDGLFMGSIDAVDTSNSTYRITLDRHGLGTYSIPDYEVLSNDPQDLMPISAFAIKHRPRHNYFASMRMASSSTPQTDDPLLGGGFPMRPNLQITEEGSLGGFPVKFLVLLVRLSKILNAKRCKLDELKSMNSEVEKMKSYQIQIPIEFQKKYASLILEFESVNKDLNEYLNNVQNFCQEVGPEQGLTPMVLPELMRERAHRDAQDMVESNRVHFPAVENQRMIELITHLTSIMIQFKCLAENDLNSFELKSLSDTVDQIKSQLMPENIQTFQDHVEIHVKHVEAGLSQLGNLCAFSSQV